MTRNRYGTKKKLLPVLVKEFDGTESLVKEEGQNDLHFKLEVQDGSASQSAVYEKQ